MNNNKSAKALFYINGENRFVSEDCLDPRLREDDKLVCRECIYYNELRLGMVVGDFL